MYRTTTVPLMLALLVALPACNKEPEGLGIAITPEAPTTVDDLAVEITAAAIDPNKNDTVTLSYTWTKDGEVQADATSAEVPAALTARDQMWEVQVVASDGKLDALPISASVTVLNSAPTTQLELPSEATTDRDLEVVATGDDIDGDEVTHSFVWSTDGSSTTYDSSSVPASATSKGERWEVSVTPSDDGLSGEAVTASVLIINTAPSVTSATIEPAEIFEATEARCVAAGWADADDDTEDYDISWSVNGTPVKTDVLTGDSFNKGDKITCTLVPNDGETTGEPVTSAATAVLNTPPRMAGVTLDPTSPTTAQALTATVSGVADADGDEVTLAYAWSVDGRTLSDSGASAGPAWRRGQTVMVSVTPSDDQDSGAPVSAEVTVGNADPVIDSVAIAPGVLLTETLASVVYSASDADGDKLKVSYNWTISGKTVGAGATLDGKVHFEEGQTIDLELKVDDGNGGTASLKAASKVVGNSPPVAPVIEIDPASPTSKDDLFCEVTTPATDPDKRDTLTYTFSWTVDSVKWTGKTTVTDYAGDTIPASETTGGDEWACSVVVSDGTDTATATAGAVDIVDCSSVSHSSLYAGAVQMHGYCWYLGKGGKTCDTVCAAVGGKNLATTASSAFADACSRPTTKDVSTWFYNNGNPAGWRSTGSTAYKTLGYGYTGSAYYGKCAAGTAKNHGTFPGDPNNSGTRTLACPCR